MPAATKTDEFSEKFQAVNIKGNLLYDMFSSVNINHY